MSIDVFVSYHKETGLETARAVVQKLEANGLRCWYQERDSGGHYASVITRMIAACRVFVVVLSQDATKSKYVKSELNLAYERDGVTILPLRMSEDKLSASATLYLAGIHWIDGVERPLDAALQDLCRHALKALGRTAPIYDPWVRNQAQTIRYADGSVYTGEVVNGKRHGKGRLTWPSGDTYEGDFTNDIIHGRGKYTYADGTVFEGEWRDGKRTGKGKLTWIRSGSIYEGDWLNDKRTGKGKLTWGENSLYPGDVYEGDWKDDKRTGKGKYTWSNGNVYEGDFMEGKKHGKGRHTYGKNTLWAGDVYEGDWLNDERTGIGTLTYADGRVKSGRWKDGIFLG